MPTKFKADSKERIQTGRSTSEARYVTKRHYMHTTPTTELESALENATPKQAQKIRNELVRRTPRI